MIRRIFTMTIASVIAMASTVAVGQAAPLPAAPPTQILKPNQTRYADVDADGRLDTVRIYNSGSTHSDNAEDKTVWKVKVTTAAGRVSSVKVPILSYLGGQRWWGSANLDGTPGTELLLEAGTEDFLSLAVLTWRGNTLHRELAPPDPGSHGNKESIWSAATEGDNSGYRFFTSHRVRYVNAWRADCPDQPGDCKVKVVRSVWRNGAWHRIAVLPTTKVSSNEIWSRRPLGAVLVNH